MGTDWGTQAWSEDLPAARVQAETWLTQVANAKGWSSAARDTVKEYVQAAYEDNDGYFSDDIIGFFQGIIHRMDTYPVAGVPNWTALRNTFASAIGATQTVEKARAEGSTAAVVKGTVSASVEDVEAAAKAVKNAANPEKSVVPWLIGLVVVVVVAAKVVK